MFTYCLANAGIPGLSYASNEHHTRQENVKTQVNQHMPAFHADPDHTGKKKKIEVRQHKNTEHSCIIVLQKLARYSHVKWDVITVNDCLTTMHLAIKQALDFIRRN